MINTAALRGYAERDAHTRLVLSPHHYRVSSFPTFPTSGCGNTHTVRNTPMYRFLCWDVSSSGSSVAAPPARRPRGSWRPGRSRRVCVVPLSGGGLSAQLRQLGRADIRRISPPSAAYKSTLGVKGIPSGKRYFRTLGAIGKRSLQRWSVRVTTA